MPALSANALRFYRDYVGNVALALEQGAAAEGYITDILMRSGIRPYAVTYRIKDPASLLAKLRFKRYEVPNRQIKDLIGIRIITQYADEVDPIVRALRDAPELIVSKTHSVDKRSALGLRKFGYRSVHLVVRVRKRGGNLNWYQTLKASWFEVQARSVLEHAWAEIEHHVAYKSGVNYPDDFTRTFAALAGTLELLDRQFMGLRQMQADLIDRYRRRYLDGQDMAIPWDAARLVAFLGAVRPTGQREPTIGLPNITRVEALNFAKLSDANLLGRALDRSKFRRRLENYASLTGQAPETVSDFVVAVIAASLEDHSRFKRQFPELFGDPRLDFVAS